MKRLPALVLLVGIFAGALVLWVAWSGRAFFFTRDVSLPPATAGTEGSGTTYYSTGLYPVQIPRFGQWDVKGSFRVPTAALVSR